MKPEDRNNQNKGGSMNQKPFDNQKQNQNQKGGTPSGQGQGTTGGTTGGSNQRSWEKDSK